MIDALETSGRLRRQKDAEGNIERPALRRADKDQSLWLRRYKEAELMRLGLRDILGLADFEQNLRELSALGDACLAYALETVSRKHKFKERRSASSRSANSAARRSTTAPTWT